MPGAPRWGTLILVDSAQGTRGCCGRGEQGEVLGCYEDQALSSHGGLALSTPYQGMDKAQVGPSSFSPQDRGCQKYSHKSKSYSNAKFYKIKISAKNPSKIHTYYRILSPNKQALHLGMGGSE